MPHVAIASSPFAAMLAAAASTSSMTATLTLPTTTLRPHAAHGRRQLRVMAQGSGKTKWHAVAVANVAAARQAAAAAAQTAADPGWQQLWLAAQDGIAVCAAVGDGRKAELLVRLLLLQQLWKGCVKYADATAARHLELNCRHKQVRRASLNAICCATLFPHARSAGCISAVLRPCIASERSCRPAAAASAHVLYSPTHLHAAPLPARLCSGQQQCRSVWSWPSSWPRSQS